MQEVLPITHRPRRRCLIRSPRFQRRRRRIAAQRNSLFLVVLIECFFAHVHGPAYRTAGLAEDEPGDEAVGVEFVAADEELEDGLGVGGGGGCFVGGIRG